MPSCRKNAVPYGEKCRFPLRCENQVESRFNPKIFVAARSGKSQPGIRSRRPGIAFIQHQFAAVQSCFHPEAC